ncbi:hypothetical protein LX36DRAFT_351830 [Colletotrichum falcatum]|nr:hypothetical protein LX36DRAFT_351830 [Colletotrichum falcatum]
MSYASPSFFLLFSFRWFIQTARACCPPSLFITMPKGTNSEWKASHQSLLAGRVAESRRSLRTLMALPASSRLGKGAIGEDPWTRYATSLAGGLPSKPGHLLRMPS